MIRKITKTYATTYVYPIPGDGSVEFAVSWICDLVNSQTVHAKMIVLRDTQRRSDEGNSTVEVFPPLDSKSIQQQVRMLDTDAITLSGKLQQTPLSIHMDLKALEVGIAMDNAALLEAAQLEAVLQLT